MKTFKQKLTKLKVATHLIDFSNCGDESLTRKINLLYPLHLHQKLQFLL